MTDFVGAEKDQWLECSKCVSLRVVNDSPTQVNLFWHGGAQTAAAQGTIKRGGSISQGTFVGHVWYLVEQSSPPKYFRYVTASEKSQVVRVSELTPLAAGALAPIGSRNEMRPLARSEL